MCRSAAVLPHGNGARTWLRDEEAPNGRPGHLIGRMPCRPCSSRCRIEPYWNQGGACGAAGPASAPGSALGGPPGARQAIPAGTPIGLAHSLHRPVLPSAACLALRRPARSCRVWGVGKEGTRQDQDTPSRTALSARRPCRGRHGRRRRCGLTGRGFPVSQRASQSGHRLIVVTASSLARTVHFPRFRFRH